MFSIIDIFFIVLLVYSAYQGYKKGFIVYFFTFLALFVGLYVSIYFSEWIQIKINKTFNLENNLPYSICFTLCFLSVGAMVFFAGKAIEKVAKITMLSPINKFAGLLFSVLKTVFILSGIIYFISIYDTNSIIENKETIKKSLLYKPIKKLLVYSIPKYNNLSKKSFIDSKSISQIN